ncbi:MAG: EFR1 family ferrodoxin [Clostridiales Family XIII bacterium]|jgi:ferredoxin/flavodoxin|nr:EFR1 family ferrodoxin [Clostridiales Family XIII bacterium]
MELKIYLVEPEVKFMLLLKNVWSVFFSATGTTEKIATEIGSVVAEKLNIAHKRFSFTLPSAREKILSFSSDDLVVFATPVYAGRVPNVLLKYLGTVVGNGAMAVPVCLYGNRNYDDALIELRDILVKGGFHAIAAGAFIGEHSFSTTLAKGRPDQKDMEIARDFAGQIAAKVKGGADLSSISPIHVEGVPYPYRGYYQPRDRKGASIDIRKVKPLTSDACNNCMICAELCPMGSISHEDVREFTNICIKCCSCIKNCPVNARYYEDPGYLYHKQELEEGLARRAEPELFI